MAEPDGSKVTLGAGTLFYAPQGSTEPAAGVLTPITSPATSVAWPSAWIQLGYTQDGSEFTFTPKIDPIEVAENLYPIKYVASMVTMDVVFALAEITATHLSVVLNGGTIATASGITTFTPPVLGSERRIMLGWDRKDGLERIIWRQCIQTGAVKQMHKKPPAFNTLPASFALEVPTSGPSDPFVHYFDASLL